MTSAPKKALGQNPCPESAGRRPDNTVIIASCTVLFKKKRWNDSDALSRFTRKMEEQDFQG